MINIEEINFGKLDGLVPGIVVDNKSENVLMLGFLNKEAVAKTIELGKVTFFSRTKDRIWTKGETSGNYLKLDRMLLDCDNDSILIYAEPQGDTCHLNRYSCFKIPKRRDKDFLYTLFELIKKRKSELPENSYTTKLFKDGENRIIQKVGEEAVETVIAAKNRDKKEIIDETSDLFYHLFVMLAEQEIEFSEIVKNLESRHK